MNTAVKSAFMLAVVSLLVIGCCTSHQVAWHYSDRVMGELKEAKGKVSQLHRGMERQDVESILKPMTGPTRFGFEWNISGTLSVPYELYPGIRVTIDYGASTSTLVIVPVDLDVNLDSRDREAKHFKSIRLDEIQ
ncbi:exported hypothetical protein [Verrucomicrobia bacterium]|nr:exported hypothetical protein [Verrucomicrobiota bacterium]